jgi:hypothetical protein
MAIHVDNFNLGIFSLILVFLSCLSYFTNSERFYVWYFHKKFYKVQIYKNHTVFNSFCFPIVIGCLFVLYAN